jgi:hypothetical protein
MTMHTNVPPLVQLTDPDFAAGYKEAQEPCFADCGIRTMLTEVAVERGLSE